MEPHADQPTSELRELRLRYAGVCAKCGTALPQGAQALYHAASKTVLCVTCPDDPASSEPAPIDVGTAGASAQREHDRRAERREARVKGRFGNRLGGAILALSDEAQPICAWAQGARGEQELAGALADVPGRCSTIAGSPARAATLTIY
jgi:hypothetical protein